MSDETRTYSIEVVIGHPGNLTTGELAWAINDALPVEFFDPTDGEWFVSHLEWGFDSDDIVDADEN